MYFQFQMQVDFLLRQTPTLQSMKGGIKGLSVVSCSYAREKRDSTKAQVRQRIDLSNLLLNISSLIPSHTQYEGYYLSCRVHTHIPFNGHSSQGSFRRTWVGTYPSQSSFSSKYGGIKHLHLLGCVVSCHVESFYKYINATDYNVDPLTVFLLRY